MLFYVDIHPCIFQEISMFLDSLKQNGKSIFDVKVKIMLFKFGKQIHVDS